jgi:septal ring factor EnvC (AmiA/AmiB activator)
VPTAVSRIAGLALLFAAFAQSVAWAQDDPIADPAREAEAAQITQRLEAVREEQRSIDAERVGVRGERETTLATLREDELAIGAAAREIAQIDAQLVALGEQIERLGVDAKQIEDRLQRQRSEIAALLRSAYAAGRHERLRIMFAPEQIGRIARALAYHRYLQRDRIMRITALRRDLDALADLRARITQAQQAASQARATREQQVAVLDAARAARAQTLAALDERLADQASRLVALGRDERSMLGLLERLRDAIGDIPKVLAGAEPFASLRGRLPWPTSGRVVEGFGTPSSGGRSLEGVRIAAAQGAPVRAVSHGRVAFADWMAGYGLLLIVDHGDGYMSLYAHNDALRSDVGDWVDSGEVIAAAGSSGGRSEPGVYFELRAKGQPVDPVRWLADRR